MSKLEKKYRPGNGFSCYYDVLSSQVVYKRITQLFTRSDKQYIQYYFQPYTQEFYFRESNTACWKGIEKYLKGYNSTTYIESGPDKVTTKTTKLEKNIVKEIRIKDFRNKLIPDSIVTAIIKCVNDVTPCSIVNHKGQEHISLTIPENVNYPQLLILLGMIRECWYKTSTKDYTVFQKHMTKTFRPSGVRDGVKFYLQALQKACEKKLGSCNHCNDNAKMIPKTWKQILESNLNTQIGILLQEI